MPASHTANLGLNKPDRQDLVSVVTDINDNMETIDNAIGALPSSHTIQGQINTLKPVSVVLNPVTNANGETTVVTNDSRIHEGLKAVYLEVSNPETFKDKIKITTGNGTVTLYCANAVGSSDVTILVEMATVTDSADPQPASVTSTEFDILANRIGTLSQLTTTEKTNLVGAVNELNSQIVNVTHVDIGNGVILYKLGKIRILSCMNGNYSITTNGISLGETVATPCRSRVVYYNGSSNVDGYLEASANKVVLESSNTAITTGSYITGSIVFVVS